MNPKKKRMLFVVACMAIMLTACIMLISIKPKFPQEPIDSTGIKIVGTIPNPQPQEKSLHDKLREIVIPESNPRLHEQPYYDEMRKRPEYVGFSDRMIDYYESDLYKARRYGALAKLTLRVADSTGNIVPDARVSITSYVPNTDLNKSAVYFTNEGKTDAEGLFSSEMQTSEKISWSVEKNDYYTTTGRYFVDRGMPMKSVVNKRWFPWDQTIDVVLKKNRDSIKLEEKRNRIKFPANTDVGFDFFANDMTPPYGDGRESHVIFNVSGVLHAPQILYHTNHVSFLHDGGFMIKTNDSFSEFKFSYEAPIDEYVAEATLINIYDTNKLMFVKSGMENEHMLFRIRANETDDFYYGRITEGIIGGLIGADTNNAAISFIYVLNPSAGDRNLEDTLR